MNLMRLITREISYRKGSFALTLLSVAVAAACLVGTETVLKGNRIATQAIMADAEQSVATAVAEKEKTVEAAGAELEDAMRKNMLQLGFNVLILPESQDLAELHLSGSLSQTMPEEYATKLAESKIVTVNHLLPTVAQRITWPEHDLEIVLQGTRGEVPIMHRGMKKPLLEAVAPGQMVIGYEVQKKLNVNEGDSVTLMGTDFTISKVQPQRGSADDVTVWIDLGQAQHLLGKENLIHAILALECECAGDRISEIRAEIADILPGTQVIERYSQAVTRAEARSAAKVTAQQNLERERAAGAALLAETAASRQQVELQFASLAGILVPLVVLGSAAFIGALAFANVRQRRAEIGILRAIGLRSRQVLAAIVGKSLITGGLGGVAGVAIGCAIGMSVANLPEGIGSETLLGAGMLSTLLGVVVAAPLLAAVASWIPAVLAAQQDPAVVLQGE